MSNAHLYSLRENPDEGPTEPIEGFHHLAAECANELIKGLQCKARYQTDENPIGVSARMFDGGHCMYAAFFCGGAISAESDVEEYAENLKQVVIQVAQRLREGFGSS